MVDSEEPSPISSGLEPGPELEPDDSELDDSAPVPSLDELDPDEPDPDPLPPLDDPVVPVSSAGREAPVDVEPASATGHTVVETATISVVTEPTLAGQSVTVAAHDVMV